MNDPRVDRVPGWDRLAAAHERALAEPEATALAAVAALLERLPSDGEEAAAAVDPPLVLGPRRWWVGPVTLVAAAAVAAAWVFVWLPKPALAPSPSGAPESPRPIANRPFVPSPACAPPQRALGGALLLDDFEDGDARILLLEGRSGSWQRAPADASAARTPHFPEPWPAPKPGNRHALHWRSADDTIELRLQPACYDAAAVAGVRFVAQGPGVLRVSVREALPTPSPGSVDQGTIPQRSVVLTASPTLHQLVWTDFVAPRDGHSFDPHRLHSMAFSAEPNAGKLDVWLDDVAFVPRPGAPVPPPPPPRRPALAKVPEAEVEHTRIAANGKLTGVLEGWAWVAGSPRSSIAAPNPCNETGCFRGAADRLCLTGDLPPLECDATRVPTRRCDWDSHFGVMIGMNPAAPGAAWGPAAPRSFAVVYEGEAVGYRLAVHLRGEPEAHVYCVEPYPSGTFVQPESLTSECWNGEGTSPPSFAEVDRILLVQTAAPTPQPVNYCVTDVLAR